MHIYLKVPALKKDIELLNCSLREKLLLEILLLFVSLNNEVESTNNLKN